MPKPNLWTTPFVDLKTGLVRPEWHRFFDELTQQPGTTASAPTAGMQPNQLVMTGPSTSVLQTIGTRGTVQTVLHGNPTGAPSFGPVRLDMDVANNLPTARLNSGNSADNSTFWRGDGQWAFALQSVTIVPPSEGISIVQLAGPAVGQTTFTVTLANDLAAVEALNDMGLAVRTTLDTWAVRTLQQPTEGLTITDPAGVAGDPTFALANDLAGVEGLSGTGLAVRTGTDSWAVRTLQPPSAGISITNGDGISGDPTLALTHDLEALEGLSGTGLAVRTAASTWTNRQIQGTPSQIDVSDGSGVFGDPVISIALTYTGQTSINTLGTVTTGAWGADTIGQNFGGTGFNTYTIGDILYSDNTNQLAKLAIGSTGFVLTVVAGAPAWAAPVAVLDVPMGGSADRAGIVTLVAGTATVNTTAVIDPDSGVHLTAQNSGSIAAPAALEISARVDSTSFTITSADSADDRDVAWLIINPA